jgi:hypothetical protein
MDSDPQRPASKVVPIIRGKKTKNPRVVGYIRVWWCNSLGAWVTIPENE